MTYTNTLITVAEDCPIDKSEIPVSNRAKKPIHIIQYELLTDSPYQYGHEELIFEVHLKKEGLEDITGRERQAIREELFSKGHPCMRASALTKRYGFGAHYNEKGKIALYPMESEEYKRLEKDSSVKKLAAMRSKRK